MDIFHDEFSEALPFYQGFIDSMGYIDNEKESYS
jgi:hypothetical protein